MIQSIYFFCILSLSALMYSQEYMPTQVVEIPEENLTLIGCITTKNFKAFKRKFADADKEEIKKSAFTLCMTAVTGVELFMQFLCENSDILGLSVHHWTMIARMGRSEIIIAHHPQGEEIKLGLIVGSKKEIANIADTSISDDDTSDTEDDTTDSEDENDSNDVVIPPSTQVKDTTGDTGNKANNKAVVAHKKSNIFAQSFDFIKAYPKTTLAVAVLSICGLMTYGKKYRNRKIQDEAQPQE